MASIFPQRLMVGLGSDLASPSPPPQGWPLSGARLRSLGLAGRRTGVESTATCGSQVERRLDIAIAALSEYVLAFPVQLKELHGKVEFLRLPRGQDRVAVATHLAPLGVSPRLGGTAVEVLGAALASLASSKRDSSSQVASCPSKEGSDMVKSGGTTTLDRAQVAQAPRGGQPDSPSELAQALAELALVVVFASRDAE